ncbi:MAG: hypothetical protein PHY93_15445 [Bacteriovorax sp.]|nr:hypothetical protein [Bacteriovorax sp.]
MKESVKNPGDHRKISEPIPERKDFIDHLKKNESDKEKATKKSTTNPKK